MELRERLLSVTEVARRLNCRRETVRRYIATGFLPAFKLPGGYYRIREEALERCLETAVSDTKK